MNCDNPSHDKEWDSVNYRTNVIVAKKEDTRKVSVLVSKWLPCALLEKIVQYDRSSMYSSLLATSNVLMLLVKTFCGNILYLL